MKYVHVQKVVVNTPRIMMYRMGFIVLFLVLLFPCFLNCEIEYGCIA